MSRERVEDLGRLLVLLESMCTHAIFEKFEMFSKHYCVEEYLNKLNDDQKSDFFESIRFWVNDLEGKIAECVLIARAHDDLNCSHDD